MRSALLSFTMLTALAATPAMAQMAGPQPGQPGYAAGQPGQSQDVGQPPEILPAPPSHQPLVHHPTNINQRDTRSIISPALPQPPVGPNADATEYLRAAQSALTHNRTGEAQAALENAETYLLNRSVPQGAVNQPDQSPAVQNINAALQSLASGDRSQTMSLIQQTIPMAQQFETASAQGGAGMQGGAAMPGTGAGMPPAGAMNGGGYVGASPGYQQGPAATGTPPGATYGQPATPR